MFEGGRQVRAAVSILMRVGFALLPVTLAAAEVPIVFEPNSGQTHSDVTFMARGQRTRAYFNAREAVILFRQGEGFSRCKLIPLGSVRQPSGESLLPGRSNYVRPGMRISDVPQFGKVRYEQVYPGVDLVYYGKDSDLEFDHVVSAGSDPAGIRFRIDSEYTPALTKGEIVAGPLKLKRPIAYQQVDGKRRAVPVRYLLAGNTVGFAVGKYDRTQPLVIDPVLQSTYLGGRDIDVPAAVTTDAAGSIYVTGMTASTDFPKSISPFKSVLTPGDADAFVVKLNSTASAIQYATYIGGSFADYARAITVDGAGAAYITGYTIGRYPVTVGAYRESSTQAPSVFVTKVDPSGAVLAYSTYIDATGAGLGIAVDSSGDVYVAGSTYSATFPTTSGAVQQAYGGATDAFVVKLNSTGTAALYSTFLGGRGEDQATGIAIDTSGSAFVTGSTTSSDFPHTAGAYRTAYSGSTDAFITKINAAGSALTYSTFLGAADIDRGWAIAVDGNGDAYVAGQTNSSSFPVTAGAYDTSFGGGVADGFVSKLNSSGTALVYSTFIGGSGACTVVDPFRAHQCDAVYGIALEGATAWVTGIAGAGFPVVGGAQQTVSGLSDAFVAQLSANGNSLLFSNIVGGSGNEVANDVAFSSQSGAVAVGMTGSPDFPVATSALQTASLGDVEGFVTRVTSCPIIFATSSFFTPSSSGSYSIGVLADASCAWTATSNSSWLTLTSASGTGNGTVLFSVTQNPGALRAGQISIGSQTFTLNQVGGLCVTLWYTSVWFPQSGASHTVSFSSNCGWSASTAQNWITITGTTANSVSYAVSANNTGTVRSGQIVIGGQTFTVNQLGGPSSISCTYSLSKNTDVFDRGGGSSSILVSTQPGCEWLVSNSNSWIQITTGPGAAGEGVMGYSVNPNNTGQSRLGVISVQGQTLGIMQLAAQ